MSSLPAVSTPVQSEPVIFAAPQSDTEARLTLEELAAVIKATQPFFPGEIVAEIQGDPEYPMETYTVLQVKAVGDPKTIAQQHCRWAEMLVRMGQKYCAKVRLAISIQSHG